MFDLNRFLSEAEVISEMTMTDFMNIPLLLTRLDSYAFVVENARNIATGLYTVGGVYLLYLKFYYLYKKIIKK